MLMNMTMKRVRPHLQEAVLERREHSQRKVRVLFSFAVMICKYYLSPESILNTIPPTAQSIKHFAQREIELQKMKKERESRKAKYVKEAGGLKYTAIAMANRS